MQLNIRPADEADFQGVWEIFRRVVERGETYAYDPNGGREQAHSIWMSTSVRTYVACSEDELIVGTYILKANQMGPGNHVANCGYMVADDCAGQGIGKAMCAHSLEEARKLGFEAMQFNSVVSTNVAAVHLWKKMGFSIVGTVPLGFRHPYLGLVDIYIMHRFL